MFTAFVVCYSVAQPTAPTAAFTFTYQDGAYAHTGYGIEPVGVARAPVYLFTNGAGMVIGLSLIHI